MTRLPARLCPRPDWPPISRRGLSYLYAALIAFAVVGAFFAVKRMLPKRHTS